MRWKSKYDYLEHYGVKGQKHGLRRYQNEDGSLTAEGRDHYGVGDPRGKGNMKADPNAEARREKKRAALKKIAIGLGAAAAVGASAAAFKKSTNLRNEMRSKASLLAEAEADNKRHAMDQAKAAFRGAKLARINESRIKSVMPKANTHVEREIGIHNLDYAKGMRKIAERAEVRRKRYDDIAVNATRRKAVANYLKHRGRIVIK